MFVLRGEFGVIDIPVPLVDPSGLWILAQRNVKVPSRSTVKPLSNEAADPGSAATDPSETREKRPWLADDGSYQGLHGGNWLSFFIEAVTEMYESWKKQS